MIHLFASKMQLKKEEDFYNDAKTKAAVERKIEIIAHGYDVVEDEIVGHINTPYLHLLKV